MINGPWPEGCSHRDVEVVLDENGKPGIVLNEKLLDEFKKMGMKRIHVSLSHTKQNAVAVVIIED